MPGFYVFCQRIGCEGYTRVRTRWQQRRQRFCSRRCATAATRQLTRADRVKGALASKRVRQARAMEKLRGVSPWQAFRQGYQVGYKAGVRRAKAREVA